MSGVCRRSDCWEDNVLPWLSEWCSPSCQFTDLDEAGVDMRMKLRDEPGARYDNLRYATCAVAPELVEEHRRKFKTAEYVAAGGVVPQPSGVRPVTAGFYVDEICPPAPKPLPRTRRPLLAGFIRRLFP